MGRGAKACKSCGTVTGPRSFFCPNKACGKPFEMKGKVATEEKRVELEQKKQGVFGKTVDPEIDEEILHLLDFFNEVDPTPKEKEVNGKMLECYMSKDNTFRLRYNEEFMGIPLVKLHDKRYTLLKRNTNRDSHVEWDLIKRFKSLQTCLHFFRAVLNGEREAKPFVPGDDVPQSRALKRFRKKERKLRSNR
jgi:hypothetical protein